MVGERTVLKNIIFMDVSKLPEVSGNLPEVSGNFPEVSGNFPEVSRNVRQFPKVSGSFLPASRVHRAGCTEGEGGDQVPTAQDKPRKHPRGPVLLRLAGPRALQKNNYFSGGVTSRTPQFLDSVALPASSRPPTHERQFRAHFLMIRSHKSSMF